MPFDQGDAAGSELDALEAPVVGVFGAGQEVALHEAFDEVARRGQRQVEVVGDRADGLAALGGEEVERAHLRHRELQLAQQNLHVADRAPHVEVHEALQRVGALVGWGCGPRGHRTPSKRESIRRPQ
jgi:hypothetical protein